MSQWQPIETAPKDGSWFIGYCDGREQIYIVMRWWDGFFPPDDDDLSCEEEGRWTCDGDGRVEDVTHWLPFEPHPSAPPKTTGMDNFHPPYPSRAELGITQEEIDEVRAEYERLSRANDSWRGKI